MAADMHGPQTQDTHTFKYTQQLLALQKLLQAQQSSNQSPTDIAAADATVTQLRAATAALRELDQAPQQQQTVDAVQQSRFIIGNLQACAAAAACMQALAQLLLSPPSELYCEPSGAPCQPPEGRELAGEQQQLVAAAQLQLLALLVQLMKSIEAPQQQQQQQGADGSTPDDSRARNKPKYFEGIVVIEELSDVDTSPSSSTGQQQLQQQVVQALLVAAMYAPSSSSSSGSSAQPGTTHQSTTAVAAAAAAAGGDKATGSSSAVHQHVQTLESFCDSVVQQGLSLNTPWSGPMCQQHAELLVQQLLACVQLPAAAAAAAQATQHISSLGPLSSKQQQVEDPSTQPQQQQQQQQQELVCCVLPLVLDSLRDTLLAQHRHRQQQEKGKGTMGTYTGPSTFQRCLSARQLSWLVQQLQPPLLSHPTTLGLLLPLILAVADDPSPAVRQYGHAALGWLGFRAAAAAAAAEGGGELQWQGALLREEARRLVVGCEESCWGTALPAATSLVMALEGKDQRSTAYHALILELIQEAERTAQKPKPRLIFMACVAQLVPRLGLYTVRHFAALVPLLLEWTHAYDAESSVVALQLLESLVVHAWPRMAVHAGVIRQHAREVLRQERVEQGGLRQQQQQQQQSGSCGSGDVVDVGVLGDVSIRCQAAQELLQLLDGL